MKKQLPSLIGRNTVVTHSWTHSDEVGALALLMEHAASIGLDGIEHFKFVFVDAGSSVPAYLVGRDWKTEGIIALGVWGEAWGPFDEHDHPETGDSCSSLVLKYLKEHIPGFDDPRAEALVAYITRIDRKGGAKPHSIPNAIKLMNLKGETMTYDERGTNEIMTITWALKGFRAYLEYGNAKEKEFNAETIGALITEDDVQSEWLANFYESMDWQKKTSASAIKWVSEKQASGGFEHFYQLTGKYGKPFTLVAVESDNSAMHTALFSQGMDVVIIRKPSKGHVAILTSSKRPTPLHGLACMLNREELKLRNDESYKKLTVAQLSGDGTLEGSVWCFNETHWNQSLLNGSNSAPLVNPTRISFERIVRMAVLALDEHRFSTEKDGHVCSGRKCTSSKASPCRFYWYGLPRCQELQINGLKQRQGNPAGQKSRPVNQPDQKPKAKVIPIKAEALKPVQVVDPRFAALAKLRTMLVH